ncbi:voltage-dependent calcium channel subunit alpha-2/delta-3-like [Agrilus planipennis]|uniref:Voltage-dependent calcium channel subunit alpha-2/delta-3-like n=1 Tax=Agrilus planipennis TaxID=224129 RepID=A0A7F5RCA2_AGRPL|nr:voltage-dependent calcium channel subunit alpha-2/delta-3-like [Agrilus planipennis]
MQIRAFLFVFCFGVLLKKCYNYDLTHAELRNTFKWWAETLGERLFSMGMKITKRNMVAESFEGTSFVEEEGINILRGIALNMRKMMDEKESAVRRIMEAAEALSLDRQSPIDSSSSYDYYNADNLTSIEPNATLEQELHEIRAKTKRHWQYKDSEFIEHPNDHFRRLPMVKHPSFEDPVNLNYSIIRVSKSIYYRENDVLNDVRWSEPLDLTFQENYKKDPTLIWQYFASTTGFMRLYPAVKWSEEQYDQTYDYRLRNWYTEAITSPKDIVILLDKSGSMLGVRRAMAKHIINNILDTLADNDYVNIYTFTKFTDPLVDCFNDTLMQAHEENLRLLRESLGKYETQFAGNMTIAFERAFSVLEKYREKRYAENSVGTNCNQAIMLITEGIDYDYKPELFGRYNNLRPNEYYRPVRVFTYLIGTDQNDARELQWIACSNMGYYVNINTPSEIREKVLKYVDVFSRPLNLNKVAKPDPVWTGTYIDLADRRLANWLWTKVEGNRQRDIFLDYTKRMIEREEYMYTWEDNILLKKDHDYEIYRTKRNYTYVTTVSLPIYDLRPNRSKVLGAAAVDIPISYIKANLMSYRIGVNGYAFIVTNNGLIMVHPDHRTEFQNIPKPTFNRVDITEVELMDDQRGPRDFHYELLELRKNIVMRNEGYSTLDVKTHIDEMAHEENLRLLRESLGKYETQFAGNMTIAFERAFSVLEKYREKRYAENSVGTNCNQAIMLITEGIDYDYKPELFGRYNNLRPNEYYRPVRVFTYLIGTDQNDARELQWIACSNMGYYVNINTPSEIREKVLKYVDVFSRPLNLNKVAKPDPVWTGTYIDLADRRLANWLWTKVEGNRQRDIFLDYTKRMIEREEYMYTWEDNILLKKDHDYEIYRTKRNYTYVTTVSLPIYDLRPNRSKVLGAAAVDIPISYIKANLMSYRIGVNGYAFIVTNNGLIMVHPDHRTEFQNIPKPTFNRVDITEVELMDDQRGPRDFHYELLELRKNIVMRNEGYSTLDVKTHIDEMKRVIFSTRHYFYTGVGPFSVVIAIPDKYGLNRIEYKENVLHNIEKKITGLSATTNWTIHPEWLYCKSYSDTVVFENPEEELLSVIRNIRRPGWKWPSNCDETLMNLLINDAKVTQWFEDYSFYENEKELLKNHSITVIFLATHSGLTRWKEIKPDYPPFHKIHNKAIDEVWYKRAVDYYYVGGPNFVYSVPFESLGSIELTYVHVNFWFYFLFVLHPFCFLFPLSLYLLMLRPFFFTLFLLPKKKTGFDNTTPVTATSAIFREEQSKQAPISVVGYQFYHSAFYDLFVEITKMCEGHRCKVTCGSEELNCFVLDNNAYIVVSDDLEDAGNFFGDVRPDIMHELVTDGIFKKTQIFDYQAICYIDKKKATEPPSSGTRFGKFFDNLGAIINWFMTTIVYFAKIILGKKKMYQSVKSYTLGYNRLQLNKTVPTPCDHQLWLFTLNRTSYTDTEPDIFLNKECKWPYMAQPIPKSNLILLVVNGLCPKNTTQAYQYTPDPIEIPYNISHPCFIATRNNFYKRPYIKCINRNEKEFKLNSLDPEKYCGKIDSKDLKKPDKKKSD